MLEDRFVKWSELLRIYDEHIKESETDKERSHYEKYLGICLHEIDKIQKMQRNIVEEIRAINVRIESKQREPMLNIENFFEEEVMKLLTKYERIGESGVRKYF